MSAPFGPIGPGSANDPFFGLPRDRSPVVGSHMDVDGIRYVPASPVYSCLRGVTWVAVALSGALFVLSALCLAAHVAHGQDRRALYAAGAFLCGALPTAALAYALARLARRHGLGPASSRR